MNRPHPLRRAVNSLTSLFSKPPQWKAPYEAPAAWADPAVERTRLHSVARAYHDGFMAALGCAPWEMASDFAILTGMDYAAGRSLPPTMPKPDKALYSRRARTELDAALIILEPLLDSVVCYASSIDEHPPNGAVMVVRRHLEGLS